MKNQIQGYMGKRKISSFQKKRAAILFFDGIWDKFKKLVEKVDKEYQEIV